MTPGKAKKRLDASMTQAQRRDIRKALEKLQAYLDPILADWDDMDRAQREAALRPGTVLGDCRTYFAQFKLWKAAPQAPVEPQPVSRKMESIREIVEVLNTPDGD